MIKVSIIGTGNVSFHLQEAFTKAEEVHLVDVIASRSNLKELFSAKDFSNEGSRDADVLIIAVSDDAISDVARQLQNSSKLIVHTSGSVPMYDLPKKVRKGVLYPLQTFSKERDLDFKTIPLCIEADTEKDVQLLKKMAETISDSVHEVNSEKRKTLHLAAVFVNNFSNHLYQIGNELCQENKLPFDLLKPLIFETAHKIGTLNPKDAQTGPAKRNDTGTIKKHLAQLKTEKQYEIYSVLTKSIQNTYGEKL